MGEERIITRRDGTRFRLVASHLGTERVDNPVTYRHPGCPGCEREENDG